MKAPELESYVAIHRWGFSGARDPPVLDRDYSVAGQSRSLQASIAELPIAKGPGCCQGTEVGMIGATLPGPVNCVAESRFAAVLSPVKDIILPHLAKAVTLTTAHSQFPTLVYHAVTKLTSAWIAVRSRLLPSVLDGALFHCIQ